MPTLSLSFLGQGTVFEAPHPQSCGSATHGLPAQEACIHPMGKPTQRVSVSAPESETCQLVELEPFLFQVLSRMQTFFCLEAFFTYQRELQSFVELRASLCPRPVDSLVESG